MSVDTVKSGGSRVFKGLRKEVEDLELRGKRRTQRQDGGIDSGFDDGSYVSSRFDSTRRTADDDGYFSVSLRESTRGMDELSLSEQQPVLQDATTQLSPTVEAPETVYMSAMDRDDVDYAPALLAQPSVASTIRDALKPSPVTRAAPSNSSVDLVEEEREVYTDNTHYHNYAYSGDVLYLLAPYRDVLSYPNEDGDTALHLSVINFKPLVVRQILTVRPNDYAFFNQENHLGQTALHLAVATNQPHIVEDLLMAGANPARADRNGNTPLHLAARFGLCRSASLIIDAFHRKLLSLHQVLDQRNFEGFTAFHLATRAGHVEMMTLLAGRGVDVDAQDYGSGRSALHHAVESNQLSVTSALLFRLGASVDAPTFDKSTPLHLAAGHGLCDMVAVLIAAGADARLKNAEDDLPIDLAREEQILNVLQMV